MTEMAMLLQISTLMTPLTELFEKKTYRNDTLVITKERNTKMENTNTNT